MATVTIYFVGICTHVRLSETDHRVILINGSKDDIVINGHPIQPHAARLRFSKSESLPLDGVLIALNETDSTSHYDRSFETCVPKLLSYAPDLPALSEDVVSGKDRDKVSARFAAGGTYFGGVDEKGASVVRLDLETADPPTLTITGFDGSSTVRTLDPGAVLQFENVGATTTADEDFDFLLHYKIATSIPAKAEWPRTGRCTYRIDPFYPSNTVGPGCANSSYP